MFSILSKANNVIQTLCIAYELYKAAQKHIIRPMCAAIRRSQKTKQYA